MTGAAVLGEALVDLLPDDEGRFVGRPGGSPANVAVALARLGVPTHFLGRTSTDHWGDLLRAHLAADGVDLTMAPVGDEPTAIALVDVAPDGQPGYRFLWDGTADREWRLSDLPEDLGDVAVLHVGSVACLLPPGADALLALVQRERERCLVTFDPNVRAALAPDVEAARTRLLELARLAHVVKASDEDLAWLVPGADAEDIALDLTARDVPLVAITAGARGATIVGQRAQVQVAPVATTVADTVGAGDTWMAGLVAGLLASGLDSPRALRSADAAALRAVADFASTAAAITVSRVGADPPTRAEVDAARAG